MGNPKPSVDEMKERLDEVGDEIADGRKLAEETVEHKPEETFIDPGTVGTENTDDAIVPPG